MGTGSKGLSSLRERKQKRPALRSSQLSAAKRFVGHYMIGDPCKMQPLHRAEIFAKSNHLNYLYILIKFSLIMQHIYILISFMSEFHFNMNTDNIPILASCF